MRSKQFRSTEHLRVVRRPDLSCAIKKTVIDRTTKYGIGGSQTLSLQFFLIHDANRSAFGSPSRQRGTDIQDLLESVTPLTLALSPGIRIMFRSFDNVCFSEFLGRGDRKNRNINTHASGYQSLGTTAATGAAALIHH